MNKWIITSLMVLLFWAIAVSNNLYNTHKTLKLQTDIMTMQGEILKNQQAAIENQQRAIKNLWSAMLRRTS